MFGLNRITARILGTRGGSLLARRFSKKAFDVLHRWPSGIELQSRSAFVLSFDCETERDAAVLPRLVDQLKDAGVVASFAVIGALAERFPREHRALVDGGHEVFNHGYSEHTSIAADGTYTSTLLYNDLTQAQIQDEIVRGATVIEQVCGEKPLGFRAPHFGTLKVSSGEIGTLHAAITEAGASYSSSMSDLEVLRLRGTPGVVEFPLASHPDRPTAVLDSWSTVVVFGNDYVPGSLLDPMKKLLQLLKKSSSPRFAGIYLDPAQVIDLPEFVDFLRVLSNATSYVSVLRYCDLITDLSND